MPKAAKPEAHPTAYSDAVADRVLDQIIEGKTLREIEAMDGMPAKSTILRWCARHEEFEKAYGLAQQVKVEGWAEETIEIADDGSNDWMERRNADGANIGWQENGEALRRSALRVSTRQWLMERLKPKKYGPAAQKLEHSGAGGAPLIPVLNVTIGGPRSEPASEAG
jgi:hypothetical protein